MALTVDHATRALPHRLHAVAELQLRFSASIAAATMTLTSVARTEEVVRWMG